MLRFLLAFSAIILSLLHALSPSCLAAQGLRTVVLTGQSASGIEGDAIFNGLTVPTLNLMGQTAFVATVDGNGIDASNNRGIWSEGAGSLELIARTGSQAPGVAEGVTFSSSPTFYSPQLNSHGHLAFFTTLSGPGISGSNNRGIWLKAVGSLELVARRGNPAPGTLSGVNLNLQNPPSTPNSLPLVNSAGHTAFYSPLTGGGEGIWSDRSGTLSLVARTSTQAPGAPLGIDFTVVGAPTLNSASRLAFKGRVSGGNWGIWSDVPGELGLVTQTNDPAPGTHEGVSFQSFGDPAINSNGRIAFWASLNGSGIDQTNSYGIWSDRTGTLDLAVRSGSHAPGTPGDVTFASFVDPVINSSGQVAFRGNLQGESVLRELNNSIGIWSEGSGTLRLIARQGSPVPGNDSGVLFHSLQNPALNAGGQTAFMATLWDGSSLHESLWATDRDGELKLIARVGDPLEVAPGDIRTISNLSFQGGVGTEDGRRSGFNDFGQLAFSAGFVDGTGGVFVSSLVAIPEPGAFSLLLISAIGYMSCFHRR